MNRAVIIAASISLLALMLCGALLLWHEPLPSRIGTVSRENTAPSQSGVIQPAANSDASGPDGDSRKTNSQAPGNEAPDSTPKQPDVPGQPEQARPDFHRVPGTERTQPKEMETKRSVSATISGRVQLESNAPVAGADIFVEVLAQRRMKGTPDDASSPLQKVAMSDQDGAFSFALEREIFESARLTAYVSARARGYGPSPVITVEIAAGGAHGATLILREGAAVRGRVVDMQGNPVGGVKVALGKQPPYAERPGISGVYYEAVTDSTGAYAIEDVAVGLYAIGVLSYAHNYRSGPTSAAVNQGGTQLEEIVVEIVISIRVRIADSTGARIVGMCTLIFHDGKKVMQRLGAMVPEDGVIVLGYPPAGTFDVTAHIDGYFDSAPVRLTFALKANHRRRHADAHPRPGFRQAALSHFALDSAAGRMRTFAASFRFHWSPDAPLSAHDFGLRPFRPGCVGGPCDAAPATRRTRAKHRPSPTSPTRVCCATWTSPTRTSASCTAGISGQCPKPAATPRA